MLGNLALGETRAMTNVRGNPEKLSRRRNFVVLVVRVHYANRTIPSRCRRSAAQSPTDMEVRTLGFELTPSSAVGPARLWRLALEHSSAQIRALRAHLDDPSANPEPKMIGGRLIFGTEVSTYYVGVCLKVRSIRSIFKLISEGGAFGVAPEGVPKNQRVVELNYFVLHKEHFRGLYFHYFGSTSFPDFEYIWAVIHNREGRRLAKDLRQRFRAGDIDEQAFHDGVAKANVGLSGALMADRREVPDLVTDLDTVQGLSVEFVDFAPPIPLMTALSPFARRKRCHVSFAPKTKGWRIADVLRGCLNDVTMLRVCGKDDSSHAHTITLEDNAMSFAQIGYDDVSPMMRIDLGDIDASIRRSTVIRNLLRLAEKPAINAKITARVRGRTWES